MSIKERHTDSRDNPQDWPKKRPNHEPLSSPSEKDQGGLVAFKEYFVKRAIIISLAAMIPNLATATPRDQAKKIYESLAGIPPSAQVLDQLEALVKADKLDEVTALAMDQENFLRITVKQMASAWTNVQKNIDVPLNDYSATVIGIVRDGKSSKDLVSGDVIYVGESTPASKDTGLPANQRIGVYQPQNNTHYTNFENGPFSFKTELVEKSQVAITKLGAPAGPAVSSGVLTLRAFGEAYYSAGTNRRSWEAVVMTFFGKNMRDMHDLTLPGGFIRRDVDRSPGGEETKFRAECLGCHAWMDPMTKAFAHIDFVGAIMIYNAATIPAKMNRNQDTYPEGYEVKDDHWVAQMHLGTNAYMGFKGPYEGVGIESFGKFIADADQFPKGLAYHVFKSVCNHAPMGADQPIIDKMASNHVAGGYKMKSLFSDAAIACKGQ